MCNATIAALQIFKKLDSSLTRNPAVNKIKKKKNYGLTQKAINYFFQVFVHLLWELRGHGVGHQWWGWVLRNLWLGERKWSAILSSTLGRPKLLGLEAILPSERS